MNIICSQLYKKLLSASDNETIIITNTLNFLNIAKKYKLKKIGINTYDDPDLRKLHNGWPFTPVLSIFSIHQKERSGFGGPLVWRVCEEYCREYNATPGCGNHMQFSMDAKLYTGIFEFDSINKCYILKEI